MIQRIQTIYLLLTTLLSVLFLSGNMLSFSGVDNIIINIRYSGIYIISGEAENMTARSLLLVIPVILTGLISFAAIFMYKKRVIQIRLVRVSIISMFLGIAALIYYTLSIIKNNNAHPEPGFRMFLPVLIIVFLFLGRRGIKMDDELVRSYDRLR